MLDKKYLAQKRMFGNFFRDIWQMFRLFTIVLIAMFLFFGFWILTMPFHHIGMGPFSDFGNWIIGI
jgi:magnesium-transporting ATPase (P-type)